MRLYDPADWYWLGQPVGQAAAVVYSSKAAALVPLDDAGYVAFLAGDNLPSRWPTNDKGVVTYGALDDVLISASPPQPPTGFVWVPPPVRKITGYPQLVALFTPVELSAIAATPDQAVRTAFNVLTAASFTGFKATDPVFIAQIGVLSTAKVLSELRAMLVLSLLQPQ